MNHKVSVIIPEQDYLVWENRHVSVFGSSKMTRDSLQMWFQLPCRLCEWFESIKWDIISDWASTDMEEAGRTGGENIFDNLLFSNLLNSFEDASDQHFWECWLKENRVCSN